MFAKHFWKIIGLTAIVLIGGAFAYSHYVGKSANEGITFEPHIKINQDAPVTLTEYSDFECPACAQFAPIVADIIETYQADVKLEYKHFPLIAIHPNAVLAARAAEAAGQQGQFWQMHDVLFENQQTWSNSPNPRSQFAEYAKQLGLDESLFARHMRASVITDKIMAEYEEARELNLSGTPSFFLNGQKMSFTTFEEFLNQIEEAVAEAKGTTTEALLGTETEAELDIE